MIMVFGKRKIKFSKDRAVRENSALKRKLSVSEKINKIHEKSNDTPSDCDFRPNREDSGYYSSASIKRQRISSQLSVNTPIKSQLNGSHSVTPVSSYTCSQSVKRRIEFRDKITQKYFDKINQQADTMCEICCRLLYSDVTVKRNKTMKIAKLTKEMGFDTANTFDCCRTCSKALSDGKIPAFSLYNELDPGEIPDELNSLTEMETRLISRIKPYMKIYRLF